MANIGRTVQVELTVPEFRTLVGALEYCSDTFTSEVDLRGLRAKIMDATRKSVSPDYREYVNTCMWLSYVAYSEEEFHRHGRVFSQEELERAAQARAVQQIGLESK